MSSLIINADDFGLTDGVSRAIADLLHLNAVSNTTIMICVEGSARRCKEYLDFGISKKAGVHLQITPEEYHKRPLSPAIEIPTLVDSSGHFKPKDHKDWINPEEVRLEWDRQIQKVAEVLGHSPSHLDSHHGCHRYPDLTPVYLDLAEKYGIPVRGGNVISQIYSRPYKVKCSTLADSNWTGTNSSIGDLIEDIQTGLQNVESGSLEIVTHPGFCDEDLLKSSSWNVVRENDYKVLKELGRSNWLNKMGIKLLSFQEI